MKSICSASGISALLGITEPAMFGVTLKLNIHSMQPWPDRRQGSAYLAATKTLAPGIGRSRTSGFISMKPDHYMNFAIESFCPWAFPFTLPWCSGEIALGGEDGQEMQAGLKERKQHLGHGNIPKSRNATGNGTDPEIITELYVPMKGQGPGCGQSADEVLHPRPWGMAVCINPIWRAWYMRRCDLP